MQQIDRGSSLAQNVVQSMQDVLDAVEEVNGMIGKSAENNEAQNQSMEQIRVGIEDISKGVEDNSSICQRRHQQLLRSWQHRRLPWRNWLRDLILRIMVEKNKRTLDKMRLPGAVTAFLRVFTHCQNGQSMVQYISLARLYVIENGE